MSEETESKNENPKHEEEYVWLTKEEYDSLTRDLKAFSDYQRLMSVIIIISIALIILHISADLFFNLTD